MELLEAHEIRQVERDKILLIALRETQEVKKQIASTQQKNGGCFGNKTLPLLKRQKKKRSNCHAFFL
ncbi:DUF3967 domain-containing protein [Sporosarcina sp. FA15]|uniref:DUF3967 domain-containing protein n=1 Tax=Sporosarcina sp. FA15 TaxID=3413031 RepID=UPI003F656E61